MWYKKLRVAPLEPLLNSKYKAVQFHTKRNLLEINEQPVNSLWNLPEPTKLLKKQQSDGSWKYPGKYPEKPVIGSEDTNPFSEAVKAVIKGSGTGQFLLHKAKDG